MLKKPVKLYNILQTNHSHAINIRLQELYPKYYFPYSQ